jgi:adenylate cyclase
VAATRRLAAIVFTDIAGYTSLAQSDEAGALRLLQEQERLIRPLLETHRGRKVKSIGDGLLIEFRNALDAVECAVDLQQQLHERNAREGERPLRLRVGIHLGDVQRRGTDIFGDAVNIASRVEPLADPGGVCLSAQVYDQVHNKVPYQLRKLGPKSLKGVQEPMEIYQVVLPWVGREPTPGAPQLPRLAVLPLANISPDPKDEYFADGLTEELISALSKIRDLRVIARTSVSQFKSTTKTVSQIGAELGATSVLEGSVRKAGNRLRIALQLIDAGTQDHIWASTYDRELDDVFAIQTEIAEKTASALRLELLAPERESIRKEPTANLAAYDLYLKGIYAARRLWAGETESIKFFEEAIRNDPGFSQAYAQLADVFIGLAGNTLAHDEAFPRARELVAKALELDPNSSEAHMARGNLALQYDHDYGLAEAEFKRAISLKPSNAKAHFWYVILLRALTKYDNAMKESRTAAELDPLWGPPRFQLREVQCLTGDFAAAIASAEAERDREPENPDCHNDLGLIYAEAGRMADARREAELSAGCVSKGILNMEWTEWRLAVLWAQVGKPEEARRLLRELEETSRTKHVSPTWIAGVCASLGEKEKAFEWLEANNGEGASGLWIHYENTAFDSIRDDPRFRTMLEKLNLPTEVKWVRGPGAGN